MKAKRIFASKARFTLYFVSFLEDHHCLRAFLRRTGFDSIEAYCSCFYDWVSCNVFEFEDAISVGFPWVSNEFPRWRRLSQDWIKFIHSK